MPSAARPSAPTNAPATHRSPLSAAYNDATDGEVPGNAASPAPSGNQALPFQRAIAGLATPPAVAKVPATTRSPLPWLAIACTPTNPAGVPRPVPSGCHVLPARAAIPLHCTPSMSRNKPPRNTPPLPVTCTAVTRLPMPLLRIGPHAVPFQRASPVASRPSARTNGPPANTSPVKPASVCTADDSPAIGTGSMPAPIADQPTPSQRATRLAGLPPAALNSPPAITSPFGCTSSARTAADGGKLDEVPAPSGNQLAPFQRATFAAATPPAVANRPPATRSPLLANASACTRPPMPAPSGDQVVPFQRAMLAAATPFIAVNEPAATTSPFGSTVRARISAALNAVPPPIVCQVPPAKRCTLAVFPNQVASSTSPFGAAANAVVSPGGSGAPNGTHAVPFHCCRPATKWLASRVPLGSTANPFGDPASEPRLDHWSVDGSKAATRCATISPASEK